MVEQVHAKRPAPGEAEKATAAGGAGQGDAGKVKRQNVSWAWLWKNTTFCDMTIVLRSAVAQAESQATPQGDHKSERPNGTQESGGLSSQQDVLLQLPAHKVVVASASNHFRQRLVVVEQQMNDHIAAQTAEDATSSRAATLGGIVVEEEIPADWRQAAEAVLQFMYTQELVKPPNAMLLVTIARLAEKWDMPLCTQACLQQLASLTPQQLPAPLVGLIMADDLPRSVLEQPQYMPLLDACKQRLVQLFGNVQRVLLDDKVLQAFVGLPFSALKLWASLSQLKVDNENSVAVLMAHWWLHNHKTPRPSHPGNSIGSPAKDTEQLAQQREQKQQLTSLLRLNQLTSSFFAGVLTHLPFFAPSDAFQILVMARALSPTSKGAQLQQSLRDRMPPSWLAAARQRDDAPVVQHEWAVTADEMAVLHRDAEKGRMLRESPGLYYGGYVWTLCLSLNGQRDALWVGVRVRSALPAAYTVPALMEAKFTLKCKEASSKEYTRKESLSFADGAALQPANCNGSPRLLLVPACATARSTSMPPPTLVVDGKAHKGNCQHQHKPHFSSMPPGVPAALQGLLSRSFQSGLVQHWLRSSQDVVVAGCSLVPSGASAALGSSFQQVAGYAAGPSLNEDDDKAGRPTTPWVRQVISGVDLMRHPKYNKGLAFSDSERDRLYLRGLLPPVTLSQEVQLERTMLNIRSKGTELEKYIYLQGLQERNERLFYRVLCENFEELMPVVSSPVVNEACRKYGLMFKSVPRALFISLEDRGRVFRILKNWPERNVKLVVVSDGERTGAAGDLGVQAVGVPINKLSMYTASGGINPAVCLPVVIDTGTDNEELLKSPFYVGIRHRRVRGDHYYELLDEFLTAVRRRYGNTTLLQFEDMTFENASKLLNMYRTEFPCFCDDMSGQAAAVLAAVMAALPKTGGRLGDHTFIFSGEGGTISCIAELIATAIASQTHQTVLDARRRIWLVDSKGLVTRERGDAATLEGYKLPFCHSGPYAPDLATATKLLKPTVLVGFDTSLRAPPFKFDQQVCANMAAASKHPLIFPLTSEQPEVIATDAYAWTEGRCLLVTGDTERAGPVSTPSGRTHEPAQAATHYIFPGVGLGALMSECTKLRDEQFIAAAEAVARMVGEEELSRGALLPAIKDMREVAIHVAKAVAQKAYEGGYATALPKPHNLYETIRNQMYTPQYRRYR